MLGFVILSALPLFSSFAILTLYNLGGKLIDASLSPSLTH